MNAAKRNRPTAYSYLRFSSAEQMKGDSLRRQTELAQQYAEEHGLDLDDKLSFRDLGVSGFWGKNVRDGALGDFIRAINQGRVAAGSWLLVESLDRLSRDNVMNAFKRFSDILDREITVVTLQDRKTYTKRSLGENFGDLMVSLGIMFRANEESVAKSKRIKSAWESKRKRAVENGERLTSVCPQWLRAEKDGKFSIIERHAATVRRIFQEATDGAGKQAIANRLNADSIPVPGTRKGSGWRASNIQKVLESIATYGDFQLGRYETDDLGRRRRVRDGEIIKGYFPGVITEEVFLLAKRARAGRRTSIYRRSDKLSNLFTGLCRCGVCGGPMNYVNKSPSNGRGKKSAFTYLVCSHARRSYGQCSYFSWKYAPVERFVVECLQEIDLRELFPAMHASTETTLQRLNAEKVATEGQLEKAKADTKRALDLLMTIDSEGLRGRLQEAEVATKVATQGLTRITQDIAAEQRRLVDTERDQRATLGALRELRVIQGGGDAAAILDVRQRLHLLLRRTVDKIVMTPEQDTSSPLHGEIEIRFHGADYGRLVRIYRGQEEADSFKVIDGHRVGDLDLAHSGFKPQRRAQRS